MVISFVAFYRYFYTTRCAIKSSRAIHEEMLSKVLNAPVNLYFDVTPIGRILNKFSKDLDVADSA